MKRHGLLATAVWASGVLTLSACSSDPASGNEGADAGLAAAPELDASGNDALDPLPVAPESDASVSPPVFTAEGGMDARVDGGMEAGPDAREIRLPDVATFPPVKVANPFSGTVWIQSGAFWMLPDDSVDEGAGDAGVDAGEGKVGSQGVAIMERYPEAGATRVMVQVTGLVANTDYAAHVHGGPCAAGGLGHYRIDPSVESGEENEIWPSFTTGADGVGTREVLVPSHLARGDALSVVVHEPTTGDKLLCADLLPETEGLSEVRASGDLVPFAEAEAIDQGIAGTATVTWGYATGSLKAAVRAIGLDGAESYTAHLHDRPCDVAAGGNHYKVDPTVSGILESNELWPTDPLTGAPAENHAGPGRLDAQSIVLHRATGDGGARSIRVACADTMYSEFIPRGFSAPGLVALPAASSKGYMALASSGGISTRGGFQSGNETYYFTASATVEGLESGGVLYVARMHDRPCSIEGGGSPYLIDPTASPIDPDNQIIITSPSTGDGTAQFSARLDFLPRADARSLVISDLDDPGASIACVDLDSGG